MTNKPITGELRELLADINWTEIIDHMRTNNGGIVDGGWLDNWHEQAEHVCDAIDSIPHKGGVPCQRSSSSSLSHASSGAWTRWRLR